jgi:hypothetical protein
MKQSETDSLEVLRPFSTLETGSDQHRAYHTPLCCAPRLFQPPSALTPPASVTALFHAAGAPGVFPFRAFPLLKCVAPLDARSPLDVSKRFQSRSPQQAALHAPFPVRPPPGGCPSSKSVHTMPDVNPNTAADTLLGFILFKGLPRFAIKPPSRPLLSRTLTPVRRPCKQVRLPFARCPRVLLTNRVACLSRFPKKPFKTAVLLEVHSLVTLHTFLKSTPPWLIFSPRAPEHVAASRKTLFRFCSLRPE